MLLEPRGEPIGRQIPCMRSHKRLCDRAAVRCCIVMLGSLEMEAQVLPCPFVSMSRPAGRAGRVAEESGIRIGLFFVGHVQRLQGGIKMLVLRLALVKGALECHSCVRECLEEAVQRQVEVLRTRPCRVKVVVGNEE